MIRILHYTSGLAEIRAGVEIFIMNLYQNLNKDEFEFSILTRKAKTNSELYKELVRMGIKVYDLECENLGFRTLSQYISKLEYFFEIHSGEFDFIHMHGVDDPFVIKIAKKNGIKHSAVHVHAVSRENKNFIKNIMKKYTSKTNISSAEYLFACSVAAGKSMYHVQSFSVINNCIPTNDYKFNDFKRKMMRDELQLRDDNIAFCFVGRFTVVKNIPFLINVFYEVLQLMPKCKLFLVGDGEDRNSIEMQIQRLSIQNSVLLTGQRNDIGDFLQAMDVYVQTSIQEGFSLSALEAQCSGLSTFVSNGFPDEIMITDNIIRLNLNQTTKEWAGIIVNDIKENNHKQRECYAENICQAGFDTMRFVEQMGEVYRR